MARTPGTRLGPYEIVALLGVGGMGEVYRARDTRLDRDVAIKFIAPDTADDHRRIKRFEREAKAAGALSHPNIVSIFDVGSHQGARFVVMELAEGRTLREILKSGALGLQQAVDYAYQVTSALEAAHSKGIVHRDLTPGNLVVSSEGRIKVLDFGLAKLAERTDRSGVGETAAFDTTSVSESGVVVGTVPYMSPEQLRGEGVDGRTDLFALGILLYEMVTGGRPFSGATVAEVASAILRDTPAPPRAMRLDLPQDLDHLITWCLEKDPARRAPSARAVAEQLDGVRAGLARARETGSFSDISPATRSRPFRHDPPPGPVVPSIAVLPFVNRSNSEEDEYFSDGLADELINVLAKIQGLHVAGRTSSYQFKGKAEDLRVIGQKLNVAALLEGSVRKTGSRVRIAVQLVKVADGYQLWSGSYDRMLDDIFAVQDDIARSVVRELRTTLLGGAPDSEAGAAAKADVAAAVRGRGESGEAYRLLLHGRHFVSRSTRDNLLKGIGYLREAVQMDPNLALAWAELAGAYAIEAGYGWYPVDEGHERARTAAQRALALEPDLAEGHVRLGAIQMNYDRDWKGAERSIRRALELAPGNAIVLRLAGNLTSNLGLLDEALGLYERAVNQDPLSSAGYQSLGICCLAAGRLQQAEMAFRMSLELGPHRIGTQYGLALVLLAQERGEEALEAAQLEPEEVFRLMAASIVLCALGRRQESDDRLRELIDKYAEGGAYQIAEVCAARGETDAAFAWLERAYEQHDAGLVELKTEPSFRSIRDDPRWGEFLKRMRLE